MTYRPVGARERVEARRDYDARRGTARERGYTSAWTKAAKAYLAAHPLCEYCALDGHVEPAVLVDHLYPHKGDRDLFWRSDLWVPSCKPCHDGPKQAVERQGEGAIDDLARRLGRRPL